MPGANNLQLNKNAFTNSPIRTIEVGDETLTILIGQKFENNIALAVAVYPVVGKSKGILRFAFFLQFILRNRFTFN